jgi:hypothetical protein
MAKFKSPEELRAILEGGITSCAEHDFISETGDTEAVRKHFEEYDHTVSGSSICQRCKKERVYYKGLVAPPVGSEPGAFCDKCKKALAKELGLVPAGGNE